MRILATGERKGNWLGALKHRHWNARWEARIALAGVRDRSGVPWDYTGPRRWMMPALIADEGVGCEIDHPLLCSPFDASEDERELARVAVDRITAQPDGELLYVLAVRQALRAEEKASRLDRAVSVAKWLHSRAGVVEVIEKPDVDPLVKTDGFYCPGLARRVAHCGRGCGSSYYCERNPRQ